MRKRFLLLLLPSFFSLLFVAGCSPPPSDPGGATETAPAKQKSTFALVVKSLENPYMSTMYDGFRGACDELGAEALLLGPGANGTPNQAQLIQNLIDQGVDAIAIAANDMEELSPALQRAKEAGIPVVSLDSVVKPNERIVHIQQASPEIIGRVLIQACAQMLDAEGEFAILTTTDSMPNQASWVAWMHQELLDHPEQYANMRLVETAYGLDKAEPSAEAARRLLAAYPQLKAIIAPTTVGLHATAAQIARAGSPVKLTGLGLPSDMEAYIMNGICPWMYLWNPAEVGYLAAYAMDGFVEGTLKGELGEIVHAGSLGDKVVTRSEDGGFEIVLGYPKVFDMTNIAVWGELF